MIFEFRDKTWLIDWLIADGLTQFQQVWPLETKKSELRVGWQWGETEKKTFEMPMFLFKLHVWLLIHVLGKDLRKNLWDIYNNMMKTRSIISLEGYIRQDARDYLTSWLKKIHHGDWLYKLQFFLQNLKVRLARSNKSGIWQVFVNIFRVIGCIFTNPDRESSKALPRPWIDTPETHSDIWSGIWCWHYLWVRLMFDRFLSTYLGRLSKGNKK